MNEQVFTALFPFCGLGAGARGFVDAEVQLLGQRATFKALGGIDIDPEGCADFERLTGAPAWCVDMEDVTASELVRRYGPRAPDVIFMSPPCKGASGLLSKEKAKAAKYRRMNGLALTWTRRMLEAWPEGPGLVLLENVPRLTTRAKPMLRKLRSMLRKAGYVFHDGYHDCGELGGLAQHRRRYLLVARHARRVPPLLYKPPTKRVRGCGEVLGRLPLPEDPSAGALHRLPRISWLNWVRLALIPPGGDWRDLPGVLAEGEARRAKWARHGVADWSEATGTVAGSGSNGVANVADPRVGCDPRAGAYGVLDPAEPAGTVIGAGRIDNARAAVADDAPLKWFKGKYGVRAWARPSRTVIGGPSNGGSYVADPRLFALASCKPGRHHNKYRVHGWGSASGTVIGATRPGSGAPSVADPRPGGWYRGTYGVQPWDEPASTVTGSAAVSTGRFTIADPRLVFAAESNFVLMPWQAAADSLQGASFEGGGGEVAPGLRVVTGEELMAAAANPKKAPPFTPVIVAEDGTWHRPMTTLELAALQGFPMELGDEPLALAGGAVGRWRERIGNAVPCPTAQAIAEQMLVSLTQARLEAFLLSGGDVWVQPHVRGLSTSQATLTRS